MVGNSMIKSDGKIFKIYYIYIKYIIYINIYIK